MREALRLVVAEDAAVIRQGIVRLMRDAGFDVVAEATDATQLLEAVAEHRPDVAITDIRMPPSRTDEGVRAAETIRVHHPGTAVLLFSAHVEAAYLADLVRNGGEGIGYLLKDRVTDIDQLAEAIRRVAAGGLVVDAEVVGELLGATTVDDPVTHLTRREREVLELMAQGRSNAAICSGLFISPKTLEHHVAKIFHKLGLAPAADDHRRVLAVLRYLRLG